jgi:hypothetical protein
MIGITCNRSKNGTSAAAVVGIRLAAGRFAIESPCDLRAGSCWAVFTI